MLGRQAEASTASVPISRPENTRILPVRTRVAQMNSSGAVSAQTRSKSSARTMGSSGLR